MSSTWRSPLPAILLLACTAIASGTASADEAEERDLEPIARSVVFLDPSVGRPPLDAATDTAIQGEIQRAFASLGTVEDARERLVHHFGLVAVPALQRVLAANRNVTEVWNTALTIAALRDLEGPAFELLAALRPLVKVLDSGGDAHTNAMAALALGCFHYHQGALPTRYTAKPAPGTQLPASVPGVESERRRAAEALRDGRRLLATNLDHELMFFRIAASFAMAKMGGAQVARDFFAVDPPAANPQPRRARLLASAFLGAPDAKAYRGHLLGVTAKAAQTNEEASAALAMAVAMLQQEPADWTRDAKDVLRHLRGTGTSLPEAAAERVFAQGVCAYVNQATSAWDDVWAVATRATADEDVAGAAAQILVHCHVPAVEARIINMLVNPSKKPHLPVLAMVLLRAGEAGNADALPKLAEWLRERGRRPAANARWDPRWYAIVGLLRALEQGRIKPQEERVLVVDALLRAAGGTLDKDATVRGPLRALLAVHGEKLKAADETALYRLPRVEVARIERSFDCPYGLLARDAVDACVDRVNGMVEDIFGLRNVPAWKPGADNSKYQPQRYLKRYLARYPYFSRLEFRSERGRRAEPALADGVPGIDR